MRASGSSAIFMFMNGIKIAENDQQQSLWQVTVNPDEPQWTSANPDKHWIAKLNLIIDQLELNYKLQSKS